MRCSQIRRHLHERVSEHWATAQLFPGGYEKSIEALHTVKEVRAHREDLREKYGKSRYCWHRLLSIQTKLKCKVTI